MYIHLGNGEVVRSQDIIGIFDIENTSVSKFTKEFLNKCAEGSHVVYTTYELPKSFVLCLNDRRKKSKLSETKVYISQMSPSTLKRRSEYISDLSLDINNQNK